MRNEGISVLQEPPRTMSVLFLADHFAYQGGVLHGVGSYHMDVLPALSAAGIQVTVCLLRGSVRELQLLHKKGIAAVGSGCSRWSPWAIAKVLRLVREQRFDLIHAAQIKACTVARVVGRRAGIPVILHVHDDVIAPAPIRALNRLLARPEDRAICISEAVSECAARGYSAPRERQVVLHSGIDLERFQHASRHASRLRDELLEGSSGPLIGMVARFFPVKGHRAFINMLPKLLRECPQARAIFVGDGPERVCCEALARSLGVLERTRFLGQRNDIPELLDAFDIVVVPSQAEGLCLAAVEALAAGVPVVTFAIGGLPEVITHETTGLLVAPGDENSFVAALVRLGNDESLRQRMSAAARADAHRFSLSGHVQKLLELYGYASERPLESVEPDVPLAAVPELSEPSQPWRHAGLLEYTHDAIIIWEMNDKGILYWNRAAEYLYGYSRREAQGQITHRLLNTRFAGGTGRLEEILARFGVWVGELRHISKDGREIVVESRLALLSQHDGRWLVLEVNRDITDQKAAEAARLAMERQLSALHSRRRASERSDPDG